MIYNERQYKITSKEVKDLEKALDNFNDSNIPEWLAKAQKDAIKSQISELISELNEYDLMKEGKIKYSVNTEISDLPNALIAARIAKGLSQKELADALGISMQQIQRYEATQYAGANLARLSKIANILGLNITESWGGGSQDTGDCIYVWKSLVNIRWEKFPLKEMIRRNWINIRDDTDPIDMVKKYITNYVGGDYASALHRKKYHGNKSPNEYSLLAWQARVLEKANEIMEQYSMPSFSLDTNWLSDLVKLSKYEDGPIRAKNYLLQQGILLIVERHLEETYLDGAAMLSKTGSPIVAMTIRHDRLDNFWFVLFHELGHIFLHLYDSLNMDFFDEGENHASDELEIEADQFATNTLIPDEVWQLCLSQYKATEDSVKTDAESLGIHPSIVAGRIRKQRNNYRIFNNLIGQGEVRSLFGV